MTAADRATEIIREASIESDLWLYVNKGGHSLMREALLSFMLATLKRVTAALEEAEYGVSHDG